MSIFTQITNVKFYIAEPKTPLDNHTEQIEQHIRKLFLPRLDKSECLKEELKYQKSPQADATIKNQQAKNKRSEIYTQNYRNNYYITEKPTRKDILLLAITVITKNTMQLTESTLKTQTTSRNDRNNN